MKTTLNTESTRAMIDGLSEANLGALARRPGESERRQPLHTVYGGAQLFRHDLARRLGQRAQIALHAYAGDPAVLARALRLPSWDAWPEEPRERLALLKRLDEEPDAVKSEAWGAWLAHTVYRRVEEKLQREPVEDFRIDFEDGFGHRPDAEEDAEAVRCAKEVARGMAEGTLPPFIGIRVKSLSEELKWRTVRTLDLFVSTLADETGGALPDPFIVTLPKITGPAQVGVMADLLDALEAELGLADGALSLELMVELPQSLMAEDGRCALPALVDAGRGRVTGAHFGTYDYTAACNVTAEHQTMDHPACDHAKHIMQVALAGTGVFLSDGATNVMPVGPHKPDPGGSLAEWEHHANTESVHRAWRLAYDHIRHSLRGGFYQGWDLHPAQLPIRYAASFAFFLEGFDAASERLRNFVEMAAQATLVGDVFDDAATGQGLLNYFLRGLNSGAVTLAELEATGLTEEEIRGRSFLRILERRQRL